MDTLYHELVHAIDPKLTNSQVTDNLYDKLKRKNKSDKSNEFTKYLKNPAEFDAWSSTFINQFKNGLEALSPAPRQKVKSALKIIINDLLGLLKQYPNSYLGSTLSHDPPHVTVYTDFISSHESELDTIQSYIFYGDGVVGKGELYSTNMFLASMMHYLYKPSLFKRYIQRLSTLL
jgi:hypothetical protein